MSPALQKLVIPGRAVGASPEIQFRPLSLHLDSGLAGFARAPE